MKALGKVTLFGLMMVACAIGCANKKMRPMNVTVEVDRSVAGPTGALPAMDVDLVGVSDANIEERKSMPMSRYWQAMSGLRSDIRGDAKNPNVHTMSFSHARPGPQTLNRDHPIWNTWKERGAKWLVVLSNLPGRHADLPGDQDNRREILPLESYRWNGNDVKITIKLRGADVAPPPNPEKKK